MIELLPLKVSLLSLKNGLTELRFTQGEKKVSFQVKDENLLSIKLFLKQYITKTIH